MNPRTHAELANFIWDICNLLRGPYKRNEYRKVILPLTVLRRFDCVLEKTKQAVLDADAGYGGGNESVRRSLLQQASGRPFYNTSRLDFERLLDDPNNLAQNLSAYIRDFSPNVREIMERSAFSEQIARMDEKNLLFQVIQRFSRVGLSPDRVDNIQMGYVFEELIRIGAEQANEEAGEHFTPREVIRLMVSLLLSPEPDLGRGHVVKTIYDPACGTGGMLSGADQYLREHHSDANPILYGQDHNDESWAVCKSDMLLKGENAENIILGDTFTNDGYTRRPDGRKHTFDYMLANPPFGVEWKQQQRDIEREADTLGYDGRFGAGLPRINDGSLLFLQHMLAKMQPADNGGSRLAIVFNGSPLFTGDAGSGESNIRRWIIENDWLEAIVALPDQLFYNTGISTYVWVLTNRKESHRKGKVQLIDGRQFFAKMRKSLGNKRNELSPEQIDDLTRIHGNFQDGETRPITDEDPVTHEPRTRPRVVSKVFDNEDFGYRKVAVERPLRLNFAATPERVARIEDERAFQNLAKSKKRLEARPRSGAWRASAGGRWVTKFGGGGADEANHSAACGFCKAVHAATGRIAPQNRTVRVILSHQASIPPSAGARGRRKAHCGPEQVGDRGRQRHLQRHLGHAQVLRLPNAELNQSRDAVLDHHALAVARAKLVGLLLPAQLPQPFGVLGHRQTAARCLRRRALAAQRTRGTVARCPVVDEPRILSCYPAAVRGLLARRTARRPLLLVNLEIARVEHPRARAGRHLRDHFGALPLDLLASLQVAVRGVAKDFAELLATALARLGHQLCGPLAVGHVAGAHIGGQDHLILGVRHHRGLEPRERLRVALAAMAHLGVRRRDDPIRCGTPANLRLAAIFGVLVDVLRQ